MSENDKINKYLVDKFMGGSWNEVKPRNIQYELEEGYEFGEVRAFGKTGFGIRKKNN